MSRPRGKAAGGMGACLVVAVLVGAAAAASHSSAKSPAKERLAPTARPELVVQNSHGAFRFAFSSDARRVALAGRTVDVRDTTSGDLIRRFPAGDEAAAAFADGGKTLVFSYEIREGGEARCVLARADLKSGARHDIALAGDSPAGPLLLSADGTIALGLRHLTGPDFPAVPVVWNARSGAELRQLPRVAGESVALALSADGSTAALGTHRWAENRSNSTLVAFDVRTGRRRMALELPGSWVSAVTLSRDGELLGATAGDEKRYDLLAWEARTGKELLRSEVMSRGSYHPVAFSADGSRLAGAGDENGPIGGSVVRVCDMTTGAVAWEQRESLGTFQALAFEPGGALYSCTQGARVQTWDVRSGKDLRAFPEVWLSPDGTTFSPNGSHFLFSATYWHYLLDLDHLALPDPDPAFEPTPQAAFSPDGRTLAWASYHRLLSLFDVGTRSLRESAAKDPPPEPAWRFGYIRGVAFIPGTHRVATVGGDRSRHVPDYGELRIWDLETGAQQLVQRMNSVFQDVVPSADGKLLYVTEDGGDRAHVYEASGTPVRVLEVPGVRLTLAAAPARGVVATAGTEERSGRARVYLWNPATGELAGAFDPQVGHLERMTTAGNGSLTVCGTLRHARARIETWDTVRCKLRHASVVPDRASVLALTADGSLAALALPDGALGFWDAVADRLLVKLEFGFYPSGDEFRQAWIMWTPEGYYTGSKHAELAFRWRKNGTLFPASRWASVYRRPDLVQKALRNRSHASQ